MSPEQFKYKRKSLGLTQSQLAGALGLDGKSGDLTVRRWEMPADKKGSRPPNPIACKILRNWNNAPRNWDK